MVWVSTEGLIDTAFRRVVPLYSFDDRNRPYLSASAVPFESGDLRFLITAAHACFRKGKPTPLFVYGESRPHALTQLRGAWEYRSGKHPDLDIAVILLDKTCADDLQQRHWFSSPEDVGVVKPKTPGIHYLIIGYPVSRNRSRPPQYGLPGRATALITGDISSISTLRVKDKTEEYHFAIPFPYKKVPTPGGNEMQVPPPYGLSGGGVWRVEIDVVQKLASRPYLVGIGIEYDHANKTFVATKVQAATPLAWDLAHPETPTDWQ